MARVEDQFDLDIRLSVSADEPWLLGAGTVFAQTDTVAPEQTCPADTCDLGCETQTCPEETCGCSTVETCNQQLEDCGFPFTFGAYCEDQSDDTCTDCPAPSTADCADPPDYDPKS